MNAWNVIVNQLQQSTGVIYKSIEANATTKLCNVCKQELPFDKFYSKLRSNKQYYPFNPCKECTKIVNKEKRLKQKGKLNENRSSTIG